MWTRVLALVFPQRSLGFPVVRGLAVTLQGRPSPPYLPPADEFAGIEESLAQAGAAPLAAITALAALDALAPAESETVLVIGAAGASEASSSSSPRKPAHT